MKGNTVLFVGPSGAGKSNYIFRLWLALSRNPQGRVRGDGAPNELAYLRAGVNDQLTGKYAQKTPRDVHERIDIPIAIDDIAGSLTVPDRPGEDWTNLYTSRRFPDDWEDLLIAANGILIFLPSKDANPIYDRLTANRYFGTATNIKSGEDFRDKPPPTQTVIVDIIQLLLERHRQLTGGLPPPRIGVLLTAWDELSKDEREAGPQEQLRQEQKILSDFMLTSKGEIGIEVFGVSLYGGDLNDQEFSGQLEDLEPHTLGYVWHHLNGKAEESRDLTLPLQWALDAMN